MHITLSIIQMHLFATHFTTFQLNAIIYDFFLNSENLPYYWWDEFQESVPMSTYLLAFVVSDFSNITDGRFSVWARPNAIESARYALEVGPKILAYFEDYFDIKYPLPKLDMIALPDFSAGGNAFQSDRAI